MKNIQSFGSIKHYRDLIILVEHNKYLWRKISNILNNTRRDLRPWAVVHRPTQVAEANKYAVQALKDTRMLDEAKILLKRGMETEFGFTFDA